jgi:hypothetical protein
MCNRTHWSEASWQNHRSRTSRIRHERACGLGITGTGVPKRSPMLHGIPEYTRRRGWQAACQTSTDTGMFMWGRVFG